MPGTAQQNIEPVDRATFELCGIPSAIRFYDAESKAIIFQIRTGEMLKGECEEGEIEIGCSYRFMGKWTNHYRYGAQFSFFTFTQDVPATQAGIVKYLCLNAPHVGQATAGKLWQAYGPSAVEVLRADPQRVINDGIMTERAANEAARELFRICSTEKTKIDLWAIFSGRGFPRKIVAACIETWGAKAPQFIRRNPFTLLVNDLPGAGFKRTDRMLQEFLPHKVASIKRQMLAAWEAMRTNTDGHTWHPRGEVIRAVMKAVGVQLAKPDAALQFGVRADWLATRQDAAGKEWVAESQKAQNELDLAEHVRRIRAWKDIRWPQAVPGISAHQWEKLRPVLSSPLAILAGTPGTGKTFTAAALLREVTKAYGQDTVCVCAPTGKAAVRITENLRRNGLNLEATTIHRRLGITRNGHDGKGWGFMFNENKPLPFSFIAVDEVSMLDTNLACSLFEAMEYGTHVLLIGDPYQLPPVGHGAPLRDLIAAGVPCGLLTEIQRNSGMIVKACAAIKDDKPFESCDRYDPATGKNLRMFECTNAGEQLECLRSIMTGMKLFDKIWDTQVLCALNEKSQVSRVPLNKMLQGILNPDPNAPAPSANGAEVIDAAALRNKTYRVGDKIICLRNCFVSLTKHVAGKPIDQVESYEQDYSTGVAMQAYLANGEIGRVEACSPGLVIARFPMPERIVLIPMRAAKESGGGAESGEGDDFGLAYAVTVHKSQGSEWPCVIVMVDDAAGLVASREHIYTAISRASKLCIIIGKKAVLMRQSKKVALEKRKTFLRDLVGK